MKKLLLLLVLLPNIVSAAFAVPWQADTTSSGFIYPSRVNGVNQGILFNSSSTLQNFTASQSTTTQATTTSLYVSGLASTSALRANTALFGGRVGVSTTTPWGMLSVTNTGTLPSFVVEDSASPDATPFVIDQVGNVSIGKSTAAEKLDVLGNVAVTGFITATSTFTFSGGIANELVSFNTGNGIDIQSGFAYVGQATGLTIVDITNPADPIVTGSTTVGTNMRDLQAVGKYVYTLSSASDRFSVVDVSNPKAPRVVGSFTSATQMDAPEALYISGDYAYVTGVQDDMFIVMDITNPFNPVVAATLVPGVDGDSFNVPEDVVVRDGYAYVSVNQSSTSTTEAHIAVIDVRNPLTPILVATTSPQSTQNGLIGLYLNGKYLYAISQTGDSLNVYDVSNPTFPAFVGSVIDTTNLNNSRYAVGAGNMLYASYENGISAFDMTNPTAPLFVATYNDTNGGGSLQGLVHLASDGSHIYGTSLDDDVFSVVRTGAVLPMAKIGFLGAGELFVRSNAVFGKDVSIGGGLTMTGRMLAGGGISTFFNSTSTTASWSMGIDNLLLNNGAVSTGNDLTFGLYSSTTRSGATGGNISTYGGFFTVTGDTGGTSSTTGLYVSAQGADTNFGIYSAAGTNFFAGELWANGSTTLQNFTARNSTTTNATTTTLGLSGSPILSGAGNVLCVLSNGSVVQDDSPLTACSGASSRTVKHAISDLSTEESLSLILSLRPVSYVYNRDFTTDQTTHLGFIAEEVSDPLLIDEGSVKGLKYVEFIPRIVGAIQEMWGRVLNHESRIEKLEREIKELKAERK